jgi:DNA repair photolyase
MQTETPSATLVFMPRAAIKGRGTAWAIEHRFTSQHHESFDDGWGTLEQAAQEEQSAPGTQIIEQTVKSILSGNDSPDIPFDLSINPYRGCEHGCVYCFARPTHSYLNLSPGLDFETKIIAKVNAVERLRATLAAPGYEALPLNIGSATDAYQPVERRLRITRGLIEVLSEFRHAFSIITKSSGIERDIDLLAPLARDNLAAVYVSVPTLDGALARIMEPRAASPERRMKTIETLSRAGIPVGVSVSPMIPFINEPELERVLERACEAGATSAFATVLRLPWEVNPLFQQWLDTHFPERARDARRPRQRSAVSEPHDGAGRVGAVAGAAIQEGNTAPGFAHRALAARSISIPTGHASVECPGQLVLIRHENHKATQARGRCGDGAISGTPA